MEVASATAFLLAMTAAMMAALEQQSRVETAYAWFLTYASASVACGALAIILCQRRFRDEMEQDQKHWYRPIVRSAPMFAKVLALLGWVSSVGYFVYLAKGDVSFSDWAAAEPRDRAAIWIMFGSFNYLWFFGFSALIRSSDVSENARGQQG